MSVESPDSDAAVNGKYHFLDVGAQKYGDCILVEFGSTRILIDGSHEKDFEGQSGFRSVPRQLRDILDESPPHRITLLVVTHCHQDHIGALPKLVSAGIIKPQWALITDHKLGFGRTDDDSDVASRADRADPRAQRLAALLREEDASDLSDAELEDFMDGAATVESKYLAMLDDLRDKGVKIVEYRGQNLPAALLTAVKKSGMQLLGPSKDQLVLSAQQIATTNDEANDAVSSELMADAGPLDVTRLYRRIVARDAVAAAAAAGRDAQAADFFNARGNGMNCQSLTLAFGPADARALLAGDMQFTEPGVKGANAEVAKLRAAVKAAGPFKLFKTTHHTSHNGQDDDLLSDLGDPPIIVHSGGSKDKSHPFPDTLQILKGRSRDIVFARTDRNGLVTVQPHLDPADAVKKSKGRLNDFTDNVPDDSIEAEAPESTAVVVAAPGRRAVSVGPGAQIVIVNLPQGPVDMTVAGVDIVVRASGADAPALRSRGVERRTPTAESARGANAPALTKPPVVILGESQPIKLAGGRDLPKLLFVTNTERLAANIGWETVRAAVSAIRESRHQLLDADARFELHDLVHARLKQDPNLVGVVILGGYDVIPSESIDVLPAALRETLRGAGLLASDLDNFIVWSDDLYVDFDRDQIPERPISRIPDGHDARLFRTALEARSLTPADRFGIRNIKRPFANTIWSDVPGTRQLNVSKTFLASGIASNQTATGAQYFMLHGNNADATLFTGEDGARSTRAFTIDKVPEAFQGLVFSGCCWGALTVDQKAMHSGAIGPSARRVDRSIALSYLKAGANAFVGCTGAHYSGDSVDANKNYAMQLHAAFWKTLPEVGYSPALALFGARRYYGDLIGSGGVRREPLDLARRLKNRAQFTCLGLGW